MTLSWTGDPFHPTNRFLTPKKWTKNHVISSYHRIVLIVNNVALSMIVMIMITVDTELKRAGVTMLMLIMIMVMIISMITVDTELKRAGVTMLRCALTDSLASPASWKYLIILSSVSSSSTSILNHFAINVIIINNNAQSFCHQCHHHQHQ